MNLPNEKDRHKFLENSTSKIGRKRIAHENAKRMEGGGRECQKKN